ncbi:MAG TPA: hypothetical protein VFO40_18635 [Chthoniobacterales bacterium]|nr:hypothetical protein [Chthoniobacterales bacterium]
MHTLFSRLVIVAVVFAASTALCGQNAGPKLAESSAKVLDAREIVSLSVAASERSWQARDHYSYLERDEDRRIDSLGHVKSEDISVSRMVFVNDVHFEQLIEHNGQLPSAEENRKRKADFDRLKFESPAQKTARLEKDQETRSFLCEVLDAFDFHLLGEETIGGRAAYILQATPHPGYRARGKYGKMFSKVEGKLWIDEQDFGWVKVDGRVTQSFSMGLFVARVQAGSHIVLEQTCVGDAVWVPKRLEVRASARILFVKSLDIQRILTFSEYRTAADSSAVRK